VIMGRKTYDSLPMRRPLPGRQNIVISRTVQEIDGAIVCSTLESALTTAKIWDQAQLESQRIAMVIGGAEIFRLAMPHATLFYRTLVALKPKADVFFHDFDPKQWYCAQVLAQQEANSETSSYRIEQWIRK
ncbi:MAG: dihydrofolate reductase, partial [Alphaproteobacteria bacterium]|nr:dihydrofolate reductase [Alphaproteobacteria bacterium]